MGAGAALVAAVEAGARAAGASAVTLDLAHGNATAQVSTLGTFHVHSGLSLATASLAVAFANAKLQRTFCTLKCAYRYVLSGSLGLCAQSLCKSRGYAQEKPLTQFTLELR
jgi:hypothetical protein